MPPGPDVRDPHARADWLPEFCSAPVLFSLLVLAASTLLIVQLAPGTSDEPSLPRVPMALLFVFAISSLVVAGLCAARARLALLPTPLAVAGTYVLVLGGRRWVVS